jgi:hypothetical protein
MAVWGFDQATSKNLVSVADAYQLGPHLKPGGSVGDFDFSQGNAAGYWYVKVVTEITAATSDTAAGLGSGEIYRRKRTPQNSNEFETTGNTITIFNQSSNAIAVNAFVFVTRSLDGTLWAVTPTMVTHGIIRVSISADFDDSSATMTGTVSKSQVSGVDSGDAITADNFIKGTGKNGDPALVYVYPDGTFDLVAHACV